MLCSVPHMLSHVFQIGWTILLTNLQNLSTWCYLHQSLSFFVFICVCFFIVTISFFFLFHPIRSPFPDFHKLNEDGELWLVYEGLKETNRLKSREIRACRNVWYLPKHCLQNALLNIWVVLHGIKTCKKELFVKC